LGRGKWRNTIYLVVKLATISGGEGKRRVTLNGGSPEKKALGSRGRGGQIANASVIMQSKKRSRQRAHGESAMAKAKNMKEKVTHQKNTLEGPGKARA